MSVEGMQFGTNAEHDADVSKEHTTTHPSECVQPEGHEPDAVPADGSVCVFRLRGLPFVATESDVATWASGFHVLESFIVRRNGRSTGEAYMTVPAAESAEVMQMLNKKYMGSRYIEVFEASAPDLEAVKALAADSRMRGFVIRLRGLPYSATAADVSKFLDGIPIGGAPDGIVFTFTPDGRPTGEAYVELEDEDGQRAAMQRHKELMGSRYVEVFVSSKADLLQAQQQNRFHFSQAALRRRWATMGPVALALPAAAPNAGIMGMGDHAGVMHPQAGAAVVRMQPYALQYGVQHEGQPMVRGQVQGPAALVNAFRGLSLSPGGAPHMQPGPSSGLQPRRPVHSPYAARSSSMGAMATVGMAPAGMMQHMRPPPPGTMFYPASMGHNGGGGIPVSMQLATRPGVEHTSPQQQQPLQRHLAQQHGMPVDGVQHDMFMSHPQQQPQQPYMMLQSMPQVWGPMRPHMWPMHPTHMPSASNVSSSAIPLQTHSGSLAVPPAGAGTAVEPE